MSKALTVLIVDDHELVRAGLRTVLDLIADMQVVGEAACGLTAVGQARRLQPDIVLLDIRLPERNGVEVCREILATCPDTRVLFLTSYADEDTVLAAVVAGAQGYVLKNSSNQVLVEAIRTVAAGRSHLDPQIMTQTFSLIRSRCRPGSRKGHALSPQEERVLKLVAEGKTNKEIADDLGLSDKTVKNYLANIFEKLQVSRRSQATAVYLTAHK